MHYYNTRLGQEVALHTNTWAGAWIRREAASTVLFFQYFFQFFQKLLSHLSFFLIICCLKLISTIGVIYLLYSLLVHERVSEKPGCVCSWDFELCYSIH